MCWSPNWCDISCACARGLFILGWVCLVVLPSRAAADCLEAGKVPGASEVLSRHLTGDCTERAREALALTADEIVSALREGKGVDLEGVVVIGDMWLDALPVVNPEALPRLPPSVRQGMGGRQFQEVRVINGPMRIRDSRVRGKISTNLRAGFLVVTGPVDMAGTTFEEDVDFSRTVFLEPVDLSGAVFRGESLFLQDRFEEQARFTQTAFGPRTRFHKAQFLENVTFLGAGFNGTAEFMEVQFERDAIFSRTYFRLGTGFSGSRFRGMLDFSEAVFEREAFFVYSIFEGDAYFRRTTFRSLADFSNAEFHGLDDFTKTVFEQEPRFSGTKAAAGGRSPGGLQDPRVLYAIAGALLILTILLVLTLRRG